MNTVDAITWDHFRQTVATKRVFFDLFNWRAASRKLSPCVPIENSRGLASNNRQKYPNVFARPMQVSTRADNNLLQSMANGHLDTADRRPCPIVVTGAKIARQAEPVNVETIHGKWISAFSRMFFGLMAHKIVVHFDKPT